MTHPWATIRDVGERVRALRSDFVTDVERPWMELLRTDGVITVRDLLLEMDLSPQVAAGLAVWLSDQVERRRLLNGETIWRYRKILRDIGPPDRDRLRAIPGYIKEAA